MKRLWRKIYRCELLREYILFGCLVFFSGSLLILEITKIVDKATSTVNSIRIAVLFAAIFLALVFLTGFFLYKKSASYILWYREIFDSVPIPLIVTGEDVEWLYINKSTRRIMGLHENREFRHLSSRHLINADGSVKNRIWRNNGKSYQIAGTRLHFGNKHAGYLIFLNGEKGASEFVETRAEMMRQVNRCIKRLSKEIEYFRGCANNISHHTVWQSNTITDLLEIIDGLVSGDRNDLQELNERISAIKTDMQQHAENGHADLERMRKVAKELNVFEDLDGSVSHENNAV